MTLLTPLKNDKSAHTEPSVMRHPASRHKSSSPITVPFKRTIIRPALLLILLIFSASHVLADKFVCTVGGISYSVNTTNKTASVVSNYYGAYSGNIIIPETIIYDNTTYSVTSIGEDAFYNSGITSMTIPNSVTSISENAFLDCHQLEFVTIGNSVTTIGEYAFRYCYRLTELISLAVNPPTCGIGRYSSAFGDGVNKADTYSARPGFSEHHTGLAIDIDNIKTSYTDFDKTKEFIWMQENAYKYGFILRYPEDKVDITGYIYEPWHYRYVGVEAAKYIYENNMTLEEYYALFLDN